MGVDFTATLDHNLSLDEVCRLPELLEGVTTFIHSDEARFCVRSDDDRDRWTIRVDPDFESAEKQLRSRKPLSLRGPLGFSLHAGTKMLHLEHWRRWTSFGKDEQMTQALRRICRCLSEAVRGRMAIYLPDSMFPSSGATYMVLDDASIHDVIDWLAGHVGPPVSSLSRFQEVGEDSPEDPYFIDRFDDLT